MLAQGRGVGGGGAVSQKRIVVPCVADDSPNIIQESLRFWIPRFEFRIPGTGFDPDSLSVELEIRIPIVNGILDILELDYDSKTQDSRCHQQKFTTKQNRTTSFRNTKKHPEFAIKRLPGNRAFVLYKFLNFHHSFFEV